MTTVTAVVLGVLLTCGTVFVIYAVGVPGDRDVRRWAGARGLQLTPDNAGFVAAYVRWGHGLRLVCCIGGYWVATALAQGLGIDAHLPGELWALTGYLVGCLWSEWWLTRLPGGTERAAALTTRRLADYLPRGLRLAQVALPCVAVGLALWCASREGIGHRGWLMTSQDSLASTASLAGWLAPALMAVVWLLQRWVVRKAQPLAVPSVVAADDAVRSSSVHLLSGTANAMVLVLIAAQVGYLGTRRAGGGMDWLAMLAVALLVVAFVGWRWFGHRAWRVRREPVTATELVNDRPTLDASVRRRSPVPLAALMAAVLIAGGLALRWWGPINPEMSMSMSGPSVAGAVVPVSTRPTPQGAQIRLWLTNRSHSSVRVRRVRTAWVTGSLGGPAPSPPKVAAVTIGGVSHGGSLPKAIDPGATLELGVELGDIVCLDTDFAPRYEVLVDLRTAAGITQTARGSIQISYPICPALLGRVERGRLDPRPAAGVQPADPDVARAAVSRAFAAVYDFTAPPSLRSALIDDPSGIDEAAAVASRHYNPLTVRAVVRDVVFTDPTHAVVGYELDADSLRFTRRGSAVLRDGTWTVTRATVCGDLAMANAACP